MRQGCAYSKIKSKVKTWGEKQKSITNLRHEPVTGSSPAVLPGDLSPIVFFRGPQYPYLKKNRKRKKMRGLSSVEV